RLHHLQLHDVPIRFLSRAILLLPQNPRATPRRGDLISQILLVDDLLDIAQAIGPRNEILSGDRPGPHASAIVAQTVQEVSNSCSAPIAAAFLAAGVRSDVVLLRTVAWLAGLIGIALATVTIPAARLRGLRV